MAKGPVKNGAKPSRPASGTNGANDKGGGTKHYFHPNKPTPVKNGVQPGKR